MVKIGQIYFIRKINPPLRDGFIYSRKMGTDLFPHAVTYKK